MLNAAHFEAERIRTERKAGSIAPAFDTACHLPGGRAR